MSPSRSASTRSLSDGASGASGNGSGAILLVAGEGLLTTFALARDEIVIGRAPECDVTISDGILSRRHARLRLGGRLTVEDLGSKNGVHLGGRRLAPHVEAELTVGESFLIGRFSFVIVRAPRPRDRSPHSEGAEALVIADPTIAGVGPLIADLARSSLSTLILGETGVGKEVLAETLHRLSGRAGRLVRVNCAALAPALIESELFGHEKGAFTGAAQRQIGLLEAAHDGTVFLDEIGELSPAAQAKLLRAIELREVTRLGGVQPIALDVRFVAATHRDLGGAIAAGQFRSDLYFRLDGVTLRIPPLRARRDRIGPLALGFLEEAAARANATRPPRLAPEVRARLSAYDWPGNVRELKAVIERALLLARGGEIAVEHLVLSPAATARRETRSPAAPAAPPLSPKESEERDRIVAALAECHGNQTRAARLLGVSRATLVNKLSIHRIPRPRK